MRVKQTGSIISFVVVGVLLALGAIGLFYWVGHGLQPTPKVEPEVKISAPTDNKKEPTKQTPKTDDSESGSTPVKPDPAAETDAQPTTTPPTPGELSQTGPGDTAGALVIIGLLSGVIVAYIRSRRRIVSL